MADFCSLCGYSDIDVSEMYETKLRPTLSEDIKQLTNTNLITLQVNGICCESCGLIGIGVNKQYEVMGFYYDSKDNHKIGYINQTDLSFVLNKEDLFYAEKRKQMGIEAEAIEREMEDFRSMISLIGITKVEFFELYKTTSRDYNMWIYMIELLMKKHIEKYIKNDAYGMGYKGEYDDLLKIISK